MKHDCLKHIVGLTLSECPCLPKVSEIKPDESLSGQYLDNLQHGLSLKSLSSINDCGQGSIWDLMDRARSEAIQDFITHFQIAVSKYNRVKYDNYYGHIGERSKNGNSRLTRRRDINGFVLNPRKKAKGLTLCINSLELGINGGASSFGIDIFNLESNEVVESVEISPNKNEAQNIALPLSNEYGHPISYAFCYDRQGGDPKNFKYHCGCTGSPLHNWQNDQLFDANGFSVKSKNDINTNCTSEYSGGLIVGFTVRCSMFDWLCQVKDDFWCSTAFGRIMSKVVVLMANSKLANYILSSDDINYYTLLHREGLYGKRNHFEKLASELITLLATEHLPQQMKSCLTCDSKSNLGFKKQEIII